MNLMVSRDKPTRLFSFCVKATVHIVAVSGGIAGHYSILPERNGVSAGCGHEDFASTAHGLCTQPAHATGASVLWADQVASRTHEAPAARASVR